MKPFPTHRPWSGGSSENWFPPFARRWSRWVRPLKLVPTLAAVPTAAEVTVGSAFTRRLTGCVDRLRLTSWRKWPRAPVEGCSRISASSPERRPSGKFRPSAPMDVSVGNETTRRALMVRTSPGSEATAAVVWSPKPTVTVTTSAARRLLPFPCCPLLLLPLPRQPDRISTPRPQAWRLEAPDRGVPKRTRYPEPAATIIFRRDAWSALTHYFDLGQNAARRFALT